MDGAVGTVRGAAIAAWLGVLVWGWQFRAALRETGHLRADQSPPPPDAGRHRKPALPPPEGNSA